MLVSIAGIIICLPLLDCRNCKGKEHVCLVLCFIPMAVIWFMLTESIIKEGQVRPCQMRRAFRPGVARLWVLCHTPHSPAFPRCAVASNDRHMGLPSHELSSGHKRLARRTEKLASPKSNPEQKINRN